MVLSLHNTLTRRKEPFRPLDPGRVRLYVCGPTVYDFAHIGNARPVIVFDQLFRLLRRRYGEDKVVYARNVTDVDDKIIESARARGESIRALTERTYAQFEADVAALNCLPPSITPRATEHIAEMVAMIAALLAKGHAYEAEGHVLFAIASMPEYGRLSGRSLDDMRAGARVEVAPYKKDPGDFVLWKPSAPDQPGWDSPWGTGRPGWHIECSAMAERHLGEQFDIHGGGVDLIFPHHENEIAQSVSAHDGRPFVSVWMHNAFLDLGGEKMSKSLGNVLTIRSLLDRFPGEALRYAVLSARYRDPLDWSDERVRQARAALDGLYTALRPVAALAPVWPDEPAVLPALEDDLNTPLAQSVLHELATRLNKAETEREKALAKGALLAAGRLMGFLEQEPDAWFRWRPEGESGLADGEIDRLVEARREARARRNFAEADRIRNFLAGRGILLEDGAQGNDLAPDMTGPAIVLCEPQLGENIGAVARAMLNCGLTDLRLVNPRDGWPSDSARAAASGADAVIDGVRIFASTEAAIADLRVVLATTARPRDMTKKVLAPQDAVVRLAGPETGVLFGRERSGLTNDQVALADAVVTFPLNPGFTSLNLAQAVLLVGWEWLKAQGTPLPASLPPVSTAATRGELVHLMRHVERALDAAGFFFPPEKRGHMVRNLRNLLARAALTQQDVRTLHGVIASLTRRE